MKTSGKIVWGFTMKASQYGWVVEVIEVQINACNINQDSTMGEVKTETS
jgi:hypothetical protein